MVNGFHFINSSLTSHIALHCKSAFAHLRINNDTISRNNQSEMQLQKQHGRQYVVQTLQNVNYTRCSPDLHILLSDVPQISFSEAVYFSENSSWPQTKIRLPH